LVLIARSPVSGKFLIKYVILSQKCAIVSLLSIPSIFFYSHAWRNRISGTALLAMCSTCWPSSCRREAAYLLGTYLVLVDKEVVDKKKELMVGTVPRLSSAGVHHEQLCVIGYFVS
jgi:hypothetical protein